MHDTVLSVVSRIVTYVRCLKSRAREMARLPASRMVCQPKWLFPNHLFLRFKSLEIKMSDFLCLCPWKRLIWKTKRGGLSRWMFTEVGGHFTFVGPCVNDYNVLSESLASWKAHVASNRDNAWRCGEYCLFLYWKEMLDIRSLTGTWNSTLIQTRYCSFRIHWNWIYWIPSPQQTVEQQSISEWAVISSRPDKHCFKT